MKFRLAAWSGLFGSVGILSGLAAEPASPPPPEPRLAVVIAIDQFRADYLERFRPYFGPGGFRRLLDEGADFEECRYRHGITQTAPGHAAILSGAHGNIHGITRNEVIDADSGELSQSIEDADAPLVGIAPGELGPAQAKNPRKTGRSPKNFLATTVGDQLKIRYGAAAHVFSASNKDRSAILLGGKLADGAYWDEKGRFVTSRYYRAELPAWVAAFNAEHHAEAAFGKTWDRLLAPAIYDAVQGPDDAPGESAENGLTRTFPKKITGGGPAVSGPFYTALDNSPFSAEMLGEFVQRAVVEEKLGRHAATDLLCVSFSQIDVVGHSYGPDSHEIMDSVLRLDRVLAALFARIDHEVGLAHCVIVLTADHGSTPTPERVQATRPGIPAGRVKLADFDAPARKTLDAAFGALPEGEMWFTRDGYGYWLRHSALAAKKLEPGQVSAVLKQSLLQSPVVAEVFTRAELLAAQPVGDSVLAMMCRSYFAPHDRDVVYVLKPYFIAKTPTGTTHGMPYDFDMHVPLLFWGNGVPRGAHPEPVAVEDLAPTLSALLHVARPPQAGGRRLF